MRIIIGLTVSDSNVAESPRPKNGCSNCNCPTAAMPPAASPLYQKMKPISILNSDTYPSESHACRLISPMRSGKVSRVATSISGREIISAQQITCHPPNSRESFSRGHTQPRKPASEDRRLLIPNPSAVGQIPSPAGCRRQKKSRKPAWAFRLPGQRRK